MTKAHIRQMVWSVGLVMLLLVCTTVPWIRYPAGDSEYILWTSSEAYYIAETLGIVRVTVVLAVLVTLVAAAEGSPKPTIFAASAVTLFLLVQLTISAAVDAEPHDGLEMAGGYVYGMITMALLAGVLWGFGIYGWKAGG